MVPEPSRRADPIELESDSTSGYGTWLNALIGGIVGIVLSFVPLSTVLGGAVAGYLEDNPPERSLRVGVLAGIVMFVPFALFVVVALLFFGFAGAPAFFGVVGLFVLLFSAVYTIGLGALGGYLGAYLKREFG